MPQYLSPGVYVEEVPSGIMPIAGVGTSTAGFIGIMPKDIKVPRLNPHYNPHPDQKDKMLTVTVEPAVGNLLGTKLAQDIAAAPKPAPKPPKGTKKESDSGTEESGPGETPKSGTEIMTETQAQAIVDTAKKQGLKTIEITFQNQPNLFFTPATEAKLCTNFGQFKRYFGDFNDDSGHRNLAHGVYGFFNNGGTRCWVMLVAPGKHRDALASFKQIDEIAIVAAPGQIDKTLQDDLLNHCEDGMLQDRFAILDSVQGRPDPLVPNKISELRTSNYAALYFPGIKVFDPASQEIITVAPSGHMAGVYARVDTDRGVHKAPANEVIRGALGVETIVSKSDQAGLNPDGVNVIRKFNGNITVWGARTWGGDDNGEWKYINVRRLFLFLRESIDQGTQWVVFEPNDRNLWAKITRNITAFLTNVWRDGALFGSTPQEAFYVKCDDETNPPEVRDLGQVITEIGVAVVKPAEFVIFRISQWAGPGQ
jgi:phage tail sheath protein FI